MQAINDLSQEEIQKVISDLGEKSYRANQILEWVYEKRATTFDQMTNLPQSLRNKLAERFSFKLVKLAREVVSERTGATKYLLELFDGNFIESVFLPHARGATLCISSQVGCAFNCSFCATGSIGLIRNLSSGEIVDQVNFARYYLSDEGRPFSNLVLMGMGEPLSNIDNVLKAIKILIEQVGIGARHITISTVGIPKKIAKLADFPHEVRLAVSINSPFDEVRSQIMPVASRYRLSEVMASIRYYYQRNRRIPTIEYVLIKDLNDTSKDAKFLADLIGNIPVKVNLINLNPFEKSPYQPTTPQRARQFISDLRARGKKVTLRNSLGCDILAGCGQLGLLASDLSRKRKRMISRD